MSEGAKVGRRPVVRSPRVYVMLERRRHPRDPSSPQAGAVLWAEAAAYTASRLFGQVVRLEDDVERHDIYGRRLAYVYLDGRNYERVLLRKGYARPAGHRAQPRARARDARRRAE